MAKTTNDYKAIVMDVNGKNHNVSCETWYTARIADLTRGGAHINRKDFGKDKTGAKQYKSYLAMTEDIWKAAANLRAAIDNGATSAETKDAEKAVYEVLKPFFKFLGKVNGKTVFKPDAFTATRLLNRCGESVKTIIITDAAKDAKADAKDAKADATDAKKKLTEAVQLAKDAADYMDAARKTGDAKKIEAAERVLDSCNKNVLNLSAKYEQADADATKAQKAYKDALGKMGSHQKQAETASAASFRKSFELFLADMLTGRNRKTGDVLKAERELEKTKEKVVTAKIKAAEYTASAEKHEADAEKYEATIAEYIAYTSPVWEKADAADAETKTA